MKTRDLLFDSYSNCCSIFHHLRVIRKSNKMQMFELENEGQGQEGEKTGLTSFDWKCSI